MSTAPIVLADLDDTLFQTGRKCPGGKVNNLKCMSRLADGSPTGYATQIQQNLLAWFGQIIPVTARSREVLARVDVPQAPAICANGGCIITEGGAVDAEWHIRLKAASIGTSNIRAVYGDLLPTIDDFGDAFRHWITGEGGMPLYICIKSNRDDVAALKDLAQSLDGFLPAGWRTHQNGNNLALMPPWLNKRHATRYLIDKLRIEYPDRPIIGIGDSSSDVGFMDLCDYAMTPTQSQLWKAMTDDNGWIA